MWTTTELEREGRRRFERALADEGLSGHLEMGALPDDLALRRCAGATRSLYCGWFFRLAVAHASAQLARGARLMLRRRDASAG